LHNVQHAFGRLSTAGKQCAEMNCESEIGRMKGVGGSPVHRTAERDAGRQSAPKK
jgi:hypothetical protein